MDKWYDDDCKVIYTKLKYNLADLSALDLTSHKDNHRLLRRKKLEFLATRRKELLSLIHTSPKTFWRTLLPWEQQPADINPTPDNPMPPPSVMF
jgi:hypothetical protein